MTLNQFHFTKIKVIVYIRFSLCYIFYTVAGRALIFGMHDACD